MSVKAVGAPVRVQVSAVDSPYPTLAGAAVKDTIANGDAWLCPTCQYWSAARQDLVDDVLDVLPGGVADPEVVPLDAPVLAAGVNAATTAPLVLFDTVASEEVLTDLNPELLLDEVVAVVSRGVLVLAEVPPAPGHAGPKHGSGAEKHR